MHFFVWHNPYLTSCTLHKGDEKFSTSPKGQKILGFCNSKDFEEIKRRIEKTLELKKLHGKKWCEYEDGE